MDLKALQALTVNEVASITRKETGKPEENLLWEIPFKAWIRCALFCDYFTQTNVSVGSGCGALEKLVIRRHEVICVDPDPKSYTPHSEIFIQPAFPVVKELIKARPKVVNDCALWLIWPPPGCMECITGTCKLERHHHVYDIEAIKLLKPKVIVLMIAADGTAGSAQLHSWLKTDFRYQVAYVCQSISMAIDDLFSHPDIVRPTLICLVRTDQPDHKNRAALTFKGMPNKYYNDVDLATVVSQLDQSLLQTKFNDEQRAHVMRRRQSALHLAFTNMMTFGADQSIGSVEKMFETRPPTAAKEEPLKPPTPKRRQIRGKRTLPDDDPGFGFVFPEEEEVKPKQSVFPTCSSSTSLEDRGFAFRFDE